MRAFVGKKQDYYIDRFQKMDSANSKNSWNWCSFLLGPYWMAYRKMYKSAIIICGLAIVLPTVLSIALSLIAWIIMPLLVLFIIPLVDGIVRFIVNIILCIIIGIRGNNIYKNHMNKCVQETAGKPSPERKHYLNEKGGTNTGAAIGVLLATAVVSGVLSALAVPLFLNTIISAYDESDFGITTDSNWSDTSDRRTGYSDAASSLSLEEAIEIIKDQVYSEEGNFANSLNYDTEDDEFIDAETCYSIHVYEDAGDHTATYGWFAVGKNSGTVYKMNLVEGEYEPYGFDYNDEIPYDLDAYDNGESYYVYNFNTANVNLRDTPSLNAPIVAKMPPGYTADVLYQTDGPDSDGYYWLYCTDYEYYGWIREDVVDIYQY
jgi:hypothetical protein